MFVMNTILDRRLHSGVGSGI